MTRKLLLASFSVDLPGEWERVDDPDSCEPLTLARKVGGLGALQFSVARYVKGTPGLPSAGDLLVMAEEFGVAHELGRPIDTTTLSSDLLLGAASFAAGGDFVRVWYVSDGWNFALATYVCENGEEDKEVVECERIVRSVSFAGASV